MEHLILRGDRLPNARVIDLHGVGQALYGFHRGRPTLLVAWRGEPPAAALLESLSTAQPRVAVLGLSDADGIAHLRAQHPTWPVLIAADPLLTLLLGEHSQQLLGFGPDLRLQARQPAAIESVATLIEQLTPPADPPARITRAAPVLLLADVLEPELCADAIAYLHEQRGGGEPSGVLHIDAGVPQFRLDPSIKMRRETHVEDPALDARLHERVMRRVLPEIARAFQFQVSRREPFKLISYHAGAGYFRPHRDNDSQDVAHRRFAMTLNLNTGAYEGGRLRFPEFGPDEYDAPAGGALVFSCSFLHEATDVTAGNRIAATTFFS